MASNSEIERLPAAAPARPADSYVDLADPESARLAQRTSAQASLRDELSKSDRTVYIFCSDGEPAACDRDSKEQFFSLPTRRLLEINDQVGRALERGELGNRIKQPDPITLYNLLSGGSSPSWRPPMLSERKSYWDTVTRPYEAQLSERLAATRGTITHAQMMENALQVTNNDRKLAILTMANFTKNLASEVRRQVTPEQIDPSMRTSFSKPRVDDIFNRIEGLADNPSERYNKEGAMYHYYGAMYASSVGGPIGTLGAWAYNNLSLRPFGYGGSSDRIKDQASNLGAKYWFALTPRELPEPAIVP